MRVYDRGTEAILAIPGTMDIVGHKIEPVNIVYHRNNIRSFKIPCLDRSDRLP